MKKFLLMLAMSTFWTVPGVAGKESGGGDAVVQEFIALGKECHRILVERKTKDIDTDKFLSILQGAQIVSTAQTILLGVELDAINHPMSQKVEVSRPRWFESGKAYRLRLVMHEIFGLMEVYDRDYVKSNALLSDFGYRLYNRAPLPTENLRQVMVTAKHEISPHDLSQVEVIVEYYELVSHADEETVKTFLKNTCWGDCASYEDRMRDLTFKPLFIGGGDSLSHKKLDYLEGSFTQDDLTDAVRSLAFLKEISYLEYEYISGDRSHEAGFLIFAESSYLECTPWMIRFAVISKI